MGVERWGERGGGGLREWEPSRKDVYEELLIDVEDEMDGVVRVLARMEWYVTEDVLLTV